MDIDLSARHLLTRPWSYLAILKGRQAEFAALAKIKSAVRQGITPLIALQPQAGDLVKTLKHIRTSMAVEGPVLLDGERMTPAVFAAELDAVWQVQWLPVPVTSIDRSSAYQDVVGEAAAALGCGVAIRLRREDLAGPPDVASRALQDFLDRLRVGPGDVDLVIDLRDIQYSHVAAERLAVMSMLNKLPHPDAWRHLAFSATAMPPTLKGMARDDVTAHPRAEWELWRTLRTNSTRLPRLPVYGDYAIAHPDPVDEVDRAVPQIANFRYTTREDWLIARGQDITRQGPGRFRDLLEALLASPDCPSPTHCDGELWMASVAEGKASTGMAKVWRTWSTVHHWTSVTEQLASLS